MSASAGVSLEISLLTIAACPGECIDSRSASSAASRIEPSACVRCGRLRARQSAACLGTRRYRTCGLSGGRKAGSCPGASVHGGVSVAGPLVIAVSSLASSRMTAPGRVRMTPARARCRSFRLTVTRDRQSSSTGEPDEPRPLTRGQPPALSRKPVSALFGTRFCGVYRPRSDRRLREGVHGVSALSLKCA